MRFTLLGIFLLIPLYSCTAQSSGVQDASSHAVRWQPFGEALSTAKQADRKLLVFVYTDWCGWCQRLQNEVYTEDSVLSYMNENFALAKLDAEGEEENVLMEGEKFSERRLAAALGVSGFPVTIFLKGNGEYITRLPGYLPPDQYLTVLKYIAEDAYMSESFEEYTKRQ